MRADPSRLSRLDFLRVLTSVSALALTGGGCQPSGGTIRVGFLGSIKAYSGEHDRSGRDGALLAAGELNAAGGIGGRSIEILIFDDEFRPERAEVAVHQLASAGAVAIIGPMTSQNAAAAVRAANEEKIVLLSPTVSTGTLTGIDDYFLRVYPEVAIVAHALASAFAARDVKLVHAVVDTENAVYTLEYAGAYFDRFVGEGGTRGLVVTFDPRQESSLSDVVERLPIAAGNNEAVLMLSTPANVAILAQALRRRVDRRLIGTSEWAASSSLIGLGGAAVEGVRVVKVFDDSAREGASAAFHAAFLARFFYEPTYSAACAYEALMTLAAVLPGVRDRGDVRAALLAGGPYKGIQSYFNFDAFGDVHRPLNVMTIKDGAFVPEQPVREE